MDNQKVLISAYLKSAANTYPSEHYLIGFVLQHSDLLYHLPDLVVEDGEEGELEKPDYAKPYHKKGVSRV